MSLTPDQFRADFPEFGDENAYTDGQITPWLAVAANFVDPCRWQTLATLGQELVAAHYLVMAVRDQAAAIANRTPGQVQGVLASKSVGDVSAGYDVAIAAPDNAGLWNQTTYGQRYIQLARLMGAGGIQLGGWCG